MGEIDEGYELTIDKEGGIAEVESTAESSVTLEVFCADNDVRISMEAMATRGHFNIGVGLSPDEATEVAYELLARAEDLEAEQQDD